MLPRHQRLLLVKHECKLRFQSEPVVFKEFPRRANGGRDIPAIGIGFQTTRPLQLHHVLQRGTSKVVIEIMPLVSWKHLESLRLQGYSLPLFRGRSPDRGLYTPPSTFHRLLLLLVAREIPGQRSEVFINPQAFYLLHLAIFTLAVNLLFPFIFFFFFFFFFFFRTVFFTLLLSLL